MHQRDGPQARTVNTKSDIFGTFINTITAAAGCTKTGI